MIATVLKLELYHFIRSWLCSSIESKLDFLASIGTSNLYSYCYCSLSLKLLPVGLLLSSLRTRLYHKARMWLPGLSVEPGE
jgi:hypothetical protein